MQSNSAEQSMELKMYNPLIVFGPEYMKDFFTKVERSIEAMSNLMGLNNINGVNKRYAFTLQTKKENLQNKHKKENEIRDQLIAMRDALKGLGLPNRHIAGLNSKYVEHIDAYELLKEKLETLLNAPKKEKKEPKDKTKTKVSARVLASLAAQETPKEAPRKRSWKEIADM